MLRGILMLLFHATVTPVMAVMALFGALIWRRHDIPFRLARPWSRWALAASGVTLRVIGRDRIQGPHALIANHSSAYDIFVMCQTYPLPLRVVAKESLTKIPIFGQAIHAGGVYPLKRGGGREDLKTLDRLAAEVRRIGACVAFYPEGTRSQDGRLGEFKMGAFAMAIRLGVPIVPVAIRGSNRVQGPNDWSVHPGVIEVEFLEPIPVEGLTQADRETLARRARNDLLAALGQATPAAAS